MIDNPIIDDVRKAGTEILDSYNGDIDAMLRDMMKRQHAGGKQVVKLSPEETKPSITRNLKRAATISGIGACHEKRI